MNGRAANHLLMIMMRLSGGPLFCARLLIYIRPAPVGIRLAGAQHAQGAAGQQIAAPTQSPPDKAPPLERPQAPTARGRSPGQRRKCILLAWK